MFISVHPSHPETGEGHGGSGGGWPTGMAAHHAETLYFLHIFLVFSSTSSFRF